MRRPTFGKNFPSGTLVTGRGVYYRKAEDADVEAADMKQFDKVGFMIDPDVQDKESFVRMTGKPEEKRPSRRRGRT